MKKEALSLYACPSCKGPLEVQGESDKTEIRAGLLLCKKEGIAYTITKGIPNLVLPARRIHTEALMKELATVRHYQGLEIDDWGYHIRLPYPETPIKTEDVRVEEGHQISTPLIRHWRDRAVTFEKLYSLIRFDPGKTILDLGAGCCWLSNRLSNRFDVIAIDIDNSQYSLGMAEAFLRSGKHFERCRGEMANIPLVKESVDIAVMSAAIEYEDLSMIAAELRRALKPGGTVYVTDSPVFNTTEWHGRAVATLRSYYDKVEAPILRERHQPLLMNSLAAEFKSHFTVEMIPAESRATAAKRSFISMIKRREYPLYPIIRARKTENSRRNSG